VSASDPKELATVRDGLSARRLGLAPAAADEGIKAVVDTLSATKRKSRVTFFALPVLRHQSCRF
jgi:hypothetical protein